ncbi:MAG: putative bifunctional diguanylate cyclase/phosphodiesterase [Solirubrobacteraceae bacterium]
MAVAVLVIGVSLSATGALLLRSSGHREARRSFDATAGNVATTLATQLRRDTDFVTTIRSVWTMQPRLGDSEFNQWYDTLDGRERQVGSLGVAVVQRVPARRLTAFQARRNADAAFGLLVGKPARVAPRGRSHYCLISAGTAILPLDDPTARLVQQDWCSPDTKLGSTQGRMLSAEVDSGRILALSADGLGLPTMFLETAYYRRGVPISTVFERRRAIAGWVVIGFDATDIISRSIGANHTLAVALYHRNPGGGWTQIGTAGTPAAKGALQHATALAIEGDWRVSVSGTVPSSGLSMSTVSLLLFVSSSLVSVLVFLLLIVLGRSRERALGMVEEKTGQLRHQALHDALTGLPNRVLALDRAEQMLARARRTRKPIAALYVDIDGFKAVNDTFGHAAGDEVLRTVAGRVAAATRDCDTAARLSGDEFLVLVETDSLEGGPQVVAQRLLDLLQDSCDLGPHIGRQMSVTASIGIAYGLDQPAEDLLSDADVALYVAKTSGKNRYVLFEPGMETEAQDRLRLELDMSEALETEQLFLVYQPTFDLASGQAVGVEALLRWRHPTRGDLLPEDFITIAEESGLIVPIGRWVLERACRQAADWRDRGHDLVMSVNVSARQLEDDLIGYVRSAVRTSGIDPSRLTLEITESTLVGDARETVRLLAAIKALGVRIAIDDFGSGYSSLAYLRQFPVDLLKIDRAFVRGVASSKQSAALTNTLVSLGKTLELETLAEGIEDPSQLQALRRQRCDQGQGFLFAHPLEPVAFEQFLTDHRRQDLAS